MLLITSEHKNSMGPIYQFSQKQEKIFVPDLEKMIKEKKLQTFSSSV